MPENTVATTPDFSVMALYRQSLQLLLRHWKFILVVGVATSLFTKLLNHYGQQLLTEHTSQQLWNIFLNLIIGNAIALGWTKNYLSISKGTQPTLKTFVDVIPKFATFLVATTLYVIVVGLGLICFVVPGIYLAARYQFIPSLIADKTIGVLESFRQSTAMSYKKEGQLMLFLLINLGLVALCLAFANIGLIIVIPFTTIAGTVLYLQLEPQSTTPIFHD